MIVVDASVVSGSLLQQDDDGAWARMVMRSTPLIAPHLMPAEVANVLRRSVRSRRVGEETASRAHRRLSALPVQLVSYATCAHRIWTLRDNLTPDDAWYVAIAESMAIPLATFDRRLARTSGPRCEFLVPG